MTDSPSATRSEHRVVAFIIKDSNIIMLAQRQKSMYDEMRLPSPILSDNGMVRCEVRLPELVDPSNYLCPI